jgi:predicted Na+-dependent transporter
MTAAQLLSPLSITLVFLMCITAGLKVRFEEVTASIKRTRLLIPGLIASFVLVPLVTATAEFLGGATGIRHLIRTARLTARHHTGIRAHPLP